MSNREPAFCAPSGCAARSSGGGPDWPGAFRPFMALPGAEPLAEAVRAAAAGELGAADVLWNVANGELRLAFVLEPEVPAEQAREAERALLLAVLRALSILLPPQVAVQGGEEGEILINGARAGGVKQQMAVTEAGAVPEWLVAALRLRLMLPAGMEGGEDAAITALSEEGGAALDGESIGIEVARCLLLVLDDWQHEGEQALTLPPDMRAGR